MGKNVTFSIDESLVCKIFKATPGLNGRKEDKNE